MVPDSGDRNDGPSQAAKDTGETLYRDHDRGFETNRYVYPVISRRSRGLSIGVNLSPSKACNYACVYCQVDRGQPGSSEPVDLNVLREELEAIVKMAADGRLFEHHWFRTTPEPLRRFNDIALSGDGEPTMSPIFAEAVERIADVKRRLAPEDVKIVLITNATLLDRENVRRGLAVMDGNNGEIWAKLDAGTQAYHERVLRSKIPLARVLENILAAAKERPVVIQTLFLEMHGEGPSDEEVAEYIDRLREMIAAGARIRCVQLHTVARRPAESWAQPLTNDRVDAIAARVRAATGLDVEAYYGYA